MIEKKNEEIFKGNINRNTISLYLYVLGGHSLFLLYKSKYLIKSSEKEEIEFYEELRNKNIISPFIPKFYGVIEKDTKEFNEIKEYMNECEIFFKYIIKKLNINYKDLDFEKSENFKKQFMNFTKDLKNAEILKQINSSFIQLEKDIMNQYNISNNKIFWCILAFIKWKSNFFKEKFIIIENCQYNLNNPSIIDIKLGISEKFSKKTNSSKIFEGAAKNLGLRIMGLFTQSFTFNSKNRYETKNYSNEEFTFILKEFLFNSNEAYNKLTTKLRILIEFIKKELKFKINFCSLLIFINKDINFKLCLIDPHYNKNDFDLFKKSDIIGNSESVNKEIVFCLNNLINLLI